MMESVKRCDWCLSDPLYIAYHDREWGVPVFDDRKHFEFLILESAQAGLSWLTILKRREGYRKAFAGFDPARVAGFNQENIESLINDPGIIRNRKKIEASINNAGRFIEVAEEFGSFSNYIWHFTEGKQIINEWSSLSEIPPDSALSDAISRDLKKRNFKFVGSITIYAHLQAAGIVNDHLHDCFRHKEVIRR